MRRIKNYKKSIGLILIIVIAFSFLLVRAPLSFQIRSYLVMYPFSKYEEISSLLRKQDIPMRIPGGVSTQEKDWFPFIMVFTDNPGFSAKVGRDLSLTILYNFGAFQWNSGSSTLFQEESPYFNSFYGGYIVKENSTTKKYGFSADGQLDVKEVFAVPEYDFTELVMKSFGCPDEKLTMNILSYEITENVAYAGRKDWIRIDSLLLTNSTEHKFKGGRRAYLQYGNPAKRENVEDFRLITTQGRIYMRYFEEYQSTIFLYVMSPNSNTLESTDQNILSKTMIGKE